MKPTPADFFTPEYIEKRRLELQKFLADMHHPTPVKGAFYLMEHVLKWELDAWYAGAGNPDRD